MSPLWFPVHLGMHSYCTG